MAGQFADPEDFVAAVTAWVGFTRDLVTAKRKSPGEDLTSALVEASSGIQQMSEDELTSMIFLLVIAGHETTVNLIGNGVHALLTHPDQIHRLRTEPELIDSAIEELLRFDSPVQVGFPLLAIERLDVGGVTVEPGEIVVPGLLAANRNPNHFTDPRRLDLGRADNHHLAFGHGIHHCIGAPLARLEGRIAIATLLQRYPRLRLAVPPDQLTWRPGYLIHGLSELPVALR